MTNEQLYLAIGVPLIVNISLITLIYVSLSNKIESLAKEFDSRFKALEQIMNAKFDAINIRITALEATMNARFDAAHQSLLRVEQVMDARIKHLEEK